MWDLQGCRHRSLHRSGCTAPWMCDRLVIYSAGIAWQPTASVDLAMLPHRCRATKKRHQLGLHGID
jgi:hypothetical protein